MPYVAVGEGLNGPFADLDRLRSERDGLPWRIALVGTAGLRAVLLRWEPGYATVPHQHPHADEIFVPLEGRAVFSVGNEPEREVGPGMFVLAERGVRHGIRVPTDAGPFTLLAAVAPNEDVLDETIE